MPRNRFSRPTVITGWNQNLVIYGNDSSSSSDSDISSASSSSHRSPSPASSVSYHSDNSEASELHSVHSNNSDPDPDDNNSVNSFSSGGSVQTNRSSFNQIDSDSSHSSRSSQTHNSDIDDNNSNLSIDGSFASVGEPARSPSPVLYDLDDSSSFRPLRLALPGTPSPSPSTSDRSNGSDRSQNSGSESFFGFRHLLRDFQRPPTPSRYGDVRSPSPTLSVAVRTESDSSENESESFHSASRIMTGSSISRTSTKTSTISFECSVCLENLDAPASIDDVLPDPAGLDNGINQINPAAGPSRGGGRGGARGGRRSASQRSKNNGPASPTDVVATHCGHLYHQICLEKWFAEQGKRTCPSCRKNVPASKQFRLYPNISMDNSKDRNDAPLNDPNVPGPSTSSAGCSVVPVHNASAPQVAEVSATNGVCASAECQDLKIIHNTLINDYNELQIRFDDLRENDELKEAQIRSLEDDNARQYDEIQRLKRQIQDAGSSPVSASANKRRRQ